MNKLVIFEKLSSIENKEKSIVFGFSDLNLPSTEYLLRCLVELKKDDEIFTTLQERAQILIPKGNKHKHPNYYLKADNNLT